MNPQNLQSQKGQSQQKSKWFEKVESWQFILGLLGLYTTLVSLFIIAPLGWLCLQIYYIKPTLDVTASRLDTTASRIDRIASALPGINVTVAREEITRDFPGLLITENPEDLKDGTVIIRVHLLDKSQQDFKTYTYNISSQNKETAVHTIAGLVELRDHYAPSFKVLTAWSHQAKYEAKIPRFVHQEASFLLRNSNPSEYIETLERIAGQPETRKLEELPDNWKGLTEDNAVEEILRSKS